MTVRAADDFDVGLLRRTRTCVHKRQGDKGGGWRVEKASNRLHRRRTRRE
jgi:hypothetical protein